MAAGNEYRHVTLLIFITNNFLRESVVQVKYATEKEVIEQSASLHHTHRLNHWLRQENSQEDTS